MGCAIVRRARGDLCYWHCQSHSAGSGDVLRHYGLVAAAMVTPRMGVDLYRGLHVHRDSPPAANSSVGVSEAGKLTESRPSKLVHFLFVNPARPGTPAS